MCNARFQVILIAILALGLGFSLASSDAVGYPAGSAVSLGANPVWAQGGRVDAGSASLVNAPADQDMVVTDILISSRTDTERANLTLADGTDVGQILVHGYDADRVAHALNHQFASGIRIPAGEFLQINASYGGELHFMFSGYYAQP